MENRILINGKCRLVLLNPDAEIIEEQINNFGVNENYKSQQMNRRSKCPVGWKWIRNTCQNLS